MRRAVILWVLVFPAIAWASEPLREAQRLFRQMEYGEALGALELARRVPNNQPADLVAIYQIQGMCLAAEGRATEAEQAYLRLLSIDPAFRLSARISPKYAEPFARALRNPKAEPGIRLEHLPAQDFKGGAEPALRVTLRTDPMGLVKALRVVLRPVGEDTPRQVTVAVGGPGAIVISLRGPAWPSESTYWLEALDEHGGVLGRLGSQNPFSLPRESAGAAVAVLPAPKPEKDRPPPREKVTAVRKPSPRIAPPPETATLGFDLIPRQVPPAQPEPQERRPSAWYQNWWVWTAAGTLALAAIIGTAVALSNQDDGPGGPVDMGVSFGHR